MYSQPPGAGGESLGEKLCIETWTPHFDPKLVIFDVMIRFHYFWLDFC